MDDITPSSPASSSASDSDAYNTESARVYFGPFKTPERKFIAASKSLFPPPQPAAVRRSPRLSSPRIRSASPMELQASDEDKRDIEQVAQLVHDSDDDAGDTLDAGVETPQIGGDLLPDEPSSVLADKIIHALDNPSPPPSPSTSLRDFDPYHTTSRDGPVDYHTDLMSLKINDALETDDENPLLIRFRNELPAPLLLSTPSSGNDVRADQDTLIDVDSFSTPPTREYTQAGAFRGMTTTLPQPTLSVDDLLSQSPSIVISATSQPLLDVVAGTSDNLPTEPHVGVKSPMFADTSEAAEELSDNGMESIVQPTSNEELLVTPLRRSTRPRRSVTPTPTPVTPVFVPPSIARTQIKKKFATPTRDSIDELNSGLQGEEETRRSPSPPTGTSTIVRVRHRSPGKVPLSFRRELGSLSPTSSNLLSTLAFVPPNEPLDGTNMDLSTNQAESSPHAQPMFPDAPSTPARSMGPIRFASPTKDSTSPNKFRITTPVPGDLTNTPARRIPIAEGIAQGHVSPEKAVKLGLQANGTPLPSISTPARRVLITESTAPALTKSSNLRPASPIKRVLAHREPSAEPFLRLGSSIKGKEKATLASQERPTTLAKLPFPLVPSTSLSTEASTSSARIPSQDNLAKAKTSPIKSNLKQPTSRIPRIGTKPYARPEPKTGLKATPYGQHPLILSLLRKHWSQTIRRLHGRMPVNHTMLKRKREPEKSPAKPRIIMLRQVPSIAAQPSEPPPAAQPALTPAPVPTAVAKGKKPAQAPMRIRRVMDPEPPVVVVPSPPQQTGPETEPTADAALQPTNDPSSSLAASPPPLPPISSANPPPGSPMDQDQPAEPQKTSEQLLEEANITAGPPNTSSTSDDTIIVNAPGLRRTTRSRRSAATQDVFQEGSSRTTSTRRKAPTFRSDDIFSGMSITALKDLTVSNTVKNQKYVVAKLETEVIRKEGTRPESPAVKIRTILQRQQDERDRKRAERANRRARRSGEDMASSDVEGATDAGFSSAPEEQGSEDEDEKGLVKHRRGQERMMITKLQKDIDTSNGHGYLEIVAKRRRNGGEGQTLKENRALKSILAPTAKALRLDTLGNLPHADSPLSDIVQENITVKKIVYDSDVSAAVAEVVAAAKNTRARSKKK
ncbi:hypothetical protein BJ912DRAFT_1107664 [Pholiota molesta]|nr:hypothetical protein BJ912DRAFT_1107664 [Pholiota molesta]